MVLELISSFLGGSLLTVVFFGITISGRITKLETTVASIVKYNESKEKIAPQTVCSFHTDIEKKVAVLEAEMKKAN